MDGTGRAEDRKDFGGSGVPEVNQARLYCAFRAAIRTGVEIHWHGLVADYRKWPGLCSRPSDWLRGVRHAERPKVFFSQKKTEWATVPYQFTVPPALRDRTPELLVQDVEALIRDKQWALQAEHIGKGFRGVKAVLNADPFSSPNSPRPKGRTNPTVAARCW